MSAVNKVYLNGNLGKDPEVRHLDNGNIVANFSMATNESYKDKNDNKVEKSEWHNCVVWGKLAEIVEKFCNNGDSISIWGKLQTRSWEKDGVTRYTTEIVVEELKMQGKKQSGDQNNTGSQDNSNSGNGEIEQLPF